MPDTSVLSKEDQKNIVHRARTIGAQSRQSAQKDLFWALGFTAVTAAIAAVVPPAMLIIAIAFPAAFGVVAGTKALSHQINAQTMQKIAKDVGKQSFAVRLHKNAQKLSKLHRVTSMTSFIGGLGFIGATLGGIVFPPLAVLAIPAAIAWNVSTLLDVATHQPNKNLKKMDTRVQVLTRATPPVALAEMANENTKGAGLKNTPSPAATFKKVVNGETPAAPTENKPTSPTPTSIKPR